MSGNDVKFRSNAEPPASGSVRPFGFPEVTSSTLANGTLLKVARLPRLPLVTAKLVMDAGESCLVAERAGLAVLSGDALEGGTLRRSGAELAEALEGIGAGLGVSTGWDTTSVSLTCLAERAEEAMGLLAEVVLEPAFPVEEVDRTRDQRLAVIEQRRMDPASLATDSVTRVIYDEGVPYGRPVGGTTQSMEGVTPDDARAFTKERYVPGSSALVVVGDVAEDEIRDVAEGVFSEWSGELAGGGVVDATSGVRERGIVIVDRPGSVQSEIRIGQVGVSRTSPDFFALQVFNTVLGGAFTSRLNLNLRERQGFTYGVRSRFAFRRDAGPFVISTAVGTEVTADAVGEAIKEVEGLVGGGPTLEEVESARDYLAGVFPLRLEAIHQVAARIGELFVYGLPDHYYASYRENIRAVSRDEVEEAGRRALRPREMAIVVVGDAEEVKGPLEELALGPVEVSSPQ
jgi:predicted Zn-dependent peptidase